MRSIWSPGLTKRDSQEIASAADGTLPVRSFPPEPLPEATYVFDGVPRAALTRRNHGLHKYPAKFIPQIPQWALAYADSGERETVLDPFCGSGTTLVEAGLRGSVALGVDISPVAVLITRAKTAHGSESWARPESILARLVEDAEAAAPAIQLRLATNDPQFGLGETWPHWFSAVSISRLLALRLAIETTFVKDEGIRSVLLASLSSVIKASSFLDEDQIKVRYVATKTPREPLEAFLGAARHAMRTQAGVGAEYERSGARFEVREGSATRLPWPDAHVDRIVTSPPYINAVDYTMAHKYSLFILGLVSARDFKDHCRTYVGMTERAVRAADLKGRPTTENARVNGEVEALWALGTPVARNRAYVVAQYFQGMHMALREARRVMKPTARAIVVVGDNRVCGRLVPTAALVEAIANSNGLATHLRFYHQLANRSSMRLNRSETGGKLDRETVLVLGPV